MSENETHPEPGGRKAEDRDDAIAYGHKPGRSFKPRDSSDVSGGVDGGAIQPGQTGDAKAL